MSMTAPCTGFDFGQWEIMFLTSYGDKEQIYFGSFIDLI
jgi:hypothetical protein